MSISCRGAGAAVHALSSGEVQLMFPGIGSVKGHILSDKLRALTMTSPQPSALAPELPTMAASGLPGYESISYTSMVASAKMPSPIINTRQQTITRALREQQLFPRCTRRSIVVTPSARRRYLQFTS